MSSHVDTRRARRARSRADPSGPPVGWKSWESLWVFLCAASFGFAGPWILLWISTRARRAWWLLVAVIFCAVYLAAFWMMDTGGLIRRDGFYWLIFACWLGTTAFAVHVNPQYLQIKWERRQSKERRAAAHHSMGRGRTGHGSSPARETGAEETRAGAPAPGPARKGAQAPDVNQVLDINTAQVGELAALPGMSSDLARRAVELRTTRGSFRSVAQFAADLGLQPHVYARLRTRLVCRAAPSAPPGFGRRVDY